MTTIIEQVMTCAVCGHDTEVAIMGSTNQCGYPDLDLRPPEMARSTIWMWVHECPSCGYCAPNLEEAEPGAKVIVQSDAFADFRAGLDGLRPLARAFRTGAFIAAERLRYSEAFHHTLHEAWVHDDAGDTVRASAARLNAVDLINVVHQEGDLLFREHGSDAVMAADLLRRAGDFERAATVCTKALADPELNGVRQVLAFELDLCGNKDADCHSLAEVFEGGSRQIIGEPGGGESE